MTADVFVARDIVRVYMPLRAYWAACVREGHLPAWYPFDGLGQPFIAMGVSGTFHPANLLHLLLPLALALKWNVLLSYVVALAGTYHLGRSWGLRGAGAAVGATAFAFSGYLVCLSNNLLYLMAAATLPWVWSLTSQALRSALPRRAVGAGALLATLLLAGDPQTFALAGAGVAVLALALPAETAPWTRFRIAGGALFLATLLSAAQWMPSLAVRSETVAGSNTAETALVWSGDPRRLLEVVLGPVSSDPRRERLLSDEVGALLDPRAESAWVDSQAFGVVPVLLLGVAVAAWRRERAFQVAAAAFVGLGWLWLGRHGGLYGWLGRALPLWSTFRYPEKLTPFPLLLAAVGAGFGWQAVEDHPAFRRGAMRAGLTVGASMTLLVAAFTLRGADWAGLLSPAWSNVPRDQAVVLVANLARGATEAALGAFLLAALCLGPVSPRLRAGGVLMIVALTLFAANGRMYWVGPPELFDEVPPLLASGVPYGPHALGQVRVSSSVGSLNPAALPASADLPSAMTLATLAALRPVTPALWGIDSMSLYLPAASKRLADVGVDSLALEGRFAVSHWAARPEQAASFATLLGAPVASDPALGLALYPNLRARPRAYLAWPHCVASAAEARGWLHASPAPPEDFVAVEGPDCPGHADAASDRGQPSPGEVLHLDVRQDRVFSEVRANAGAIWVLNDAFYSGWTATLDGAPTPILVVNGAVRGVALPAAGDHRVALSFQTPGLTPGICLSAAGLLGAILLGNLRNRRRTAPPAPSSR